MKSRDGKGQRREEKKKEDHKRESLRRKKIQVREKVGKLRNTVFFPMICGSGGSKRKVDSLKRRVRSQLARREMKNCTALWREAHFQVNMYKTHHCRTTFGRWDVEKVQGVVARSTFRSQNVQDTPGSEHFWKLRCRKKCTPLWREAHFEVKSVKNWRIRSTFWRSDVVLRGWRAGFCTLPRVSKTWGFCRIFNYNHHYTTTTTTPTLHSTALHYITLHYTPLHFTTLQLQLQLHYITLHYTHSYNYTYNCNYSTLITLH